MNDFIDNLKDNPTQALVGLVSLTAIAAGLVMAVNRGAFNPDPAQAKIEQSQQAEALRKQSIDIANKRFDEGCEGIFYSRPGSGDFAPLNEGSAVLTSAYWKEYAATKRDPGPGDYLPAGTPVCDVYGNAAILETQPGKPNPVISNIVNTPDRERIQKMIARYPGAIRHNAANSITTGN